jgi:hypothetical protein
MNMGENEPVKESTCEERRIAQNAQTQLMFAQIQKELTEIKGDVKDMKARTDGYVSWEVFREKCKEIEDLKRFSWKAAGIVSVIPTLLALAGLVVKIVK